MSSDATSDPVSRRALVAHHAEGIYPARDCRLSKADHTGAGSLWQYSVWIFETRPELHAHILFVGNRSVADILRQSRLCIAAKIEPVTNIEGLKKYLAKERTPEAGYRRRDLGGRIRGSHRLPGGGDRVRLSRQLERDTIEAGLVDPWKHTNAKRSAQRTRCHSQLPLSAALCLAWGL